MFGCYYSSCSNTYKSKYNLLRHINSFHLKIKNFLCDNCGSAFASKQNLKEHQNIHLGKKPYSCPELGCHKTFRQASQLAAHSRTHQRADKVAVPSEEVRPLLLTSLVCFTEKPSVRFEVAPSDSAPMLPLVEESRKCPECKLPVLPVLLKYI